MDGLEEAWEPILRYYERLTRFAQQQTHLDSFSFDAVHAEYRCRAQSRLNRVEWEVMSALLLNREIEETIQVLQVVQSFYH